MCNLCLHHTHFGLSTFQALNDYGWLVAPGLENMGMNCRNKKGMEVEENESISPTIFQFLCEVGFVFVF